MELIKTGVSYYTAVLSKTVICEESADAIVPDVEPDLLRIICAEGSVDLQEESFQKDRAMVSGTIRTVICYLPEKEEKPRKMEIPISFAHMEEAKGIGDGSKGIISCNVLHVHARSVNSRKISVTASLQVSYQIYTKKEMEFCTDIQSEKYSLELLKGEKELYLPVKMQNKALSILEDLEISEKNAEFLSARCEVEAEEIKMMVGKAVIRGTARVQQSILQEDGQFGTLVHNLPFTHIVEMEEGEESDHAYAVFQVRNLSCVKRDDHTISVGITADTLLKVMDDMHLPVILDLYQTEYELNTQADNVFVNGEKWIPEKDFTYTASVETGNRAERILDCYGVWEKEMQNNTLPVDIHLLYEGEDQNPYSILRRIQIPLEEEKDFMPEQVVMTITPSVGAKDSIELKIRGRCQGIEESRQAIANIQQVEVMEDQKREKKPFHVVVRYMEDGENLWDAAKKYHTTRQEIRDANHLEETAERVEKGILLIPVKN